MDDITTNMTNQSLANPKDKKEMEPSPQVLPMQKQKQKQIPMYGPYKPEVYN